MSFNFPFRHKKNKSRQLSDMTNGISVILIHVRANTKLQNLKSLKQFLSKRTTVSSVIQLSPWEIKTWDGCMVSSSTCVFDRCAHVIPCDSSLFCLFITDGVWRINLLVASTRKKGKMNCSNEALRTYVADTMVYISSLLLVCRQGDFLNLTWLKLLTKILQNNIVV